MPTILTGRRPAAGPLQVASEHPRNLFTLLGGDHRLDVFEALTDICRTPCERQLREPFGRRMRGLVSSIVEQRAGAAAGHAPARRGRDLRRGSAHRRTADPEGRDESVRRFLATTQDVRFERFLDTLGDGSRPR